MNVFRQTLILTLLSFGVFANQLQQSETADQQFRGGQWGEAAQSYLELTASHPDNGFYWQRLGQARMRLKDFSSALSALEAAAERVTEKPQLQQLYLLLARVHAALGKVDQAVVFLNRIAALGGTPYLAVVNAPEFAGLAQHPEFVATTEMLKPCQTSDHRAFDFWLGEWQVTAPTRPDWQARSSISLANGGCAIRESYQTPGGYAGSSVNFFDAAKGHWHQTWIDNQGAPLYLVGGIQDGAMVLTDGASQITWTQESDGRVRQHWEVTADGGETFSTAFDGYYERVREASE